MLKSNIKFHALAIAILCVTITLFYTLFSPAPPPAPVDPNLVGDRAVEIYSASWGLECNPVIQAALEKQKMQPPVTDPKAIAESEKTVGKLELAQKDNALMRVGEICNGKNACEVTATDEALGTNLFRSCVKKLDIAYRCYSYDRLWNISLGQGETRKIDCNAAATPTGK